MQLYTINPQALIQLFDFSFWGVAQIHMKSKAIIHIFSNKMLTRQFCQQLNCLEFAKNIFLSTTLTVLIFRYFKESLIKYIQWQIQGRALRGPATPTPSFILVKKEEITERGKSRQPLLFINVLKGGSCQCTFGCWSTSKCAYFFFNATNNSRNCLKFQCSPVF